MSEDSIISLQNVNKWFGDFHVLKDVDLQVKKKERIVVCGPSGSGKSTMIRCINRLEEHQEGTIIVDGIELTGNLKNIDSVRKEVGMVFQQFNLFPHLSVKPPKIEGKLRFVKIGNIDFQPCGGTHVKSTREIGEIKIGKIENKGKMNRRVNILIND